MIHTKIVKSVLGECRLLARLLTLIQSAVSDVFPLINSWIQVVWCSSLREKVSEMKFLASIGGLVL